VKTPAPTWITPLHRYSGAVAFALTVPVALNCIWALSFATYNWRVVIHSVAGCLFYGAYAAKMLGLRLKGLPGWALPVLGGSVLTLLVALWLTAALWFFTRTGVPLT
jgi:thiamine transporter ThiT